MGSCDRCSKTETCTSAVVIYENLDYKLRILSSEILQNIVGYFFDVMRLHQLHQNIPRKIICNIKSSMVFSASFCANFNSCLCGETGGAEPCLGIHRFSNLLRFSEFNRNFQQVGVSDKPLVRGAGTWWAFRIFFIFSARGRGRGSSRRQEGRFSLKIPGGGGVRGGRGAGRAPAGNFGGGGAKYFFSGPKCPPRGTSRPEGALERVTTHKLQLSGPM